MIDAIREWIIATLQQPMQEALDFARQQSVVYVEETGSTTGNFSCNNPTC